MPRIFFATLLALFLASNNLTPLQQQDAAQTKLIASFESPEETERLRLTDAVVTPVTAHATDGKLALKIEFKAARRPAVQFTAGEKPWDWRPYGALAIDLTNPGNEEISFGVRIEDDPGADDAHHSVTGHTTIGPHLSVSYSYPIGPTMPMENGMRGGPPFPGIEPIIYASFKRVDEGHVTGFQIFLDRPAAPRTLILDNVRLLPPVSYDGIVDAFGQYTRADWPDKVKSEGDLVRARADEDARIQAAPTLPDRDEFGGWASGPQLTPTGFFTTAKRDGKWWLVTPSGHLFLSFGVDVVGLSEGPTMIDGREKMFTWLPKEGDPLARHFGHTAEVLYGPTKKGRTFDFYSANLERKYGADWRARFLSFSLDRLRAWGFNTIANWSDPALYEMKRVPYTATIDLSGDYARVASGQDYWGKMHDPYDPKFAAAVEKNIRETVDRYRDDPWCLGYFIDNEISWGSGEADRGHFGLAYGALAEDRNSPAKRAFIDQLKLHYGKLKKLNRAWNARFSSWDALLNQSFRPAEPLTPQMRQDFADFLKRFAEQYFSTIRDALRKYDPNHLYLGCRFAWRTPEAVAAAALYCDVVSFNIYRSHVDARDWEFTKGLSKPVIIGEFHFGALDRGMFHTGLVSTPNQQARAEMYRDYVRSVVDHPAFVGCAWFEYVDEPLTGRVYDGENYNIGLVAVTDTPYPELIAAAKAVHGEAYQRRNGK
ncbi:MAG: beta-galactosidase [Terriglobia bacterium]